MIFKKAVLFFLIVGLPLCGFDGPESIVSAWSEPQHHALLRSMHRELAKVPKWDESDRAEAQLLVHQAVNDELDEWKESSKGRLALILLLDQFPRALWHRTAQAYLYDNRALALSLEGIEQGADRGLAPIEKLFFYLPLLHSEELIHQHTAVRKIKELSREAMELGDPLFEDMVEMALFRRDLIERFGRFPQRNEVLGRLSAQDELEALRESPIKL